MLLGFCGENKGNKKRLKPKRGLQPNFYPAKKLLADSNIFLHTCPNDF